MEECSAAPRSSRARAVLSEVRICPIPVRLLTEEGGACVRKPHQKSQSAEAANHLNNSHGSN